MAGSVLALASGRPALTASDDIATLITALGDPDYAVRETAAARLAALGPRSADALLTAAETSADLEVALRAGWLAASLPPTSPDDLPEVQAALGRYDRADAAGRLRIMRRLLRLDDDAGIEPLARLVRLDRMAAGSSMAAALLAGEWQRDDPFWQLLRPRIAAGIQESSRPAARFLRALVDATAPDGNGVRAAAAEAAAALELLERVGGLADGAAPGSDGREAALGIFRGCLVDLHLAAGDRPAALAVIRRMFSLAQRPDAGEDADDQRTAGTLIWAIEHGLPEAVDLLEERWPGLAIDRPLTGYAAAAAHAARGDERRATRLAAAALAADTADPLRSATLLAKWGQMRWAIPRYRAVLDEPQTSDVEFAFAAILLAELLHDLGRDDEAAATLRHAVDGRPDAAGTLRRMERDPAEIRARAVFFASCAAAARGDTAGRRQLVEEALGHHPHEVDSLIALYEMAAATPADLADAKARVARALERIEDEIQALPDDANGYNEYAWLVANTTGDLATATRYSRRSLEMSFDTSSYLDTLAHCRFAAGDVAAAIRIQSRAHRLEPHGRTIARNLERFRAAAGDRP